MATEATCDSIPLDEERDPLWERVAVACVRCLLFLYVAPALLLLLVLTHAGILVWQIVLSIEACLHELVGWTRRAQASHRLGLLDPYWNQGVAPVPVLHRRRRWFEMHGRRAAK